MGTKDEILVAAERMFAERGFEVSLREIGAAAGQRNNSAVQYHFGDKAGLVTALYEYRMAPLDARRRALLDDVHAKGRERELPALVDAYLTPLAEHLVAHRGVSWYARFISRFVLAGRYRDWPFAGEYYSGMREVFGLFARRLPGLTDERLRIVNLHVVMVLADVEQRLDDPRFPAEASATAFAELRTTTLAVLEA
ncbi:TetR/AcrR family transcriptional regulator [Cryptosporangium aurantiacum]|uniref:Transcriptional regulator, TetR family n=1 Tax=Cryptosporangium aurantiacum TaxID=134849 RepID=A0A1M7RAL5_9ACTN|nr:TetR/AcrR family transcriptional regulator [Cryptosporangium aurantiacum]SHN43169.1 transcriptional regulator, TetR family [Cryptosporangium aurantiacum]